MSKDIAIFFYLGYTNSTPLNRYSREKALIFFMLKFLETFYNHHFNTSSIFQENMDFLGGIFSYRRLHIKHVVYLIANSSLCLYL